jgi:hypothetical protein
LVLFDWGLVLDILETASIVILLWPSGTCILINWKSASTQCFILLFDVNPYFRNFFAYWTSLCRFHLKILNSSPFRHNVTCILKLVINFLISIAFI